MLGLDSKGLNSRCARRAFLIFPLPNFTYQGEIFWTIRFSKEQTRTAGLVTFFPCRGRPVGATKNPTEQVFSHIRRCVDSSTPKGKRDWRQNLGFNYVLTGTWTRHQSKLHHWQPSESLHALFSSNSSLQPEVHYYTQKSTSEKTVNNITVFPGHHIKCCGIQQREIPVNLH